MTEQEIFKAEVLFKIAEKRLSQAEAAQKLGIFDRHIRRLYRAYKKVSQNLIFTFFLVIFFRVVIAIAVYR